MKNLIFILSMLLSTAVAFAATNTSLPAGVTPVTSLDLNSPNQDLMPFLGMTQRAKIVGLGEAVHTDGSFHKINARLTRALIEKQGFRTVLLETPRSLARGLQDYVQTCDSNSSLVRALQNILPQFSSVELAALFTWMRNFNCSHPRDQVTLMGMDIQAAVLDEHALEKFVTSQATPLVMRLPDLRLCTQGVQDAFSMAGPTSDADLKKCLDFLTDLEPYIKKQEPTTRFDLELSSTALHYNAGYARYASTDEVAETWRDEGMAAMIRKIVDHSPGKKTIVIAHYWHVGRGFEQVYRAASPVP